MLFLSEFQPMACDSSVNCSSRGSCESGVCICSVQFAGDQCSLTNAGFIAAFSSLFSVLFLVSFVQLILCIQAEYRKLKHASLWAACRITTQKLLYFLALIAALTRVLYFSLMGAIPDKWLETMELAFDPLMITGMSLVVCYWSEAFFLEDASADASRKGRFLSKSWLAFCIFNLFLYLAVIAQFVVVCTGASGIVAVNHWLNGAFQSFFAVVLFVVYIVFMTVGVEIFFKVRGAFNRREDEPSTSTGSSEDTINTKEVLKSRLAIVFQALFLLLMVLCVVSKAVETLWRDKVDIQTRSIHTILHRMAEVGVVLWFPCVLWNSACPEQLWFLNPRKLLRLRECQVVERLLPSRSGRHSGYSTFNIPDEKSSEGEEPECWICYDNEESLGPFISPCLCKGGMAKVHHNCLQRWLIENSSNGEEASCNVCKHKYTIHEKPIRMLSCIHCSKRTFIVIPVLALCVAAPCVAVYIFRNQSDLSTPVKVIILGISILVSLVCLRVLGISFSRLYNITRQSAMRILNYDSVELPSPTSSSSSQSRKIHSHHYRTIPSYGTVEAEIHVHRTKNDESPDLAVSVQTNELSLSSCQDTLNDESPDLAVSVQTNELSLSSCQDTLSLGSF